MLFWLKTRQSSKIFIIQNLYQSKDLDCNINVYKLHFTVVACIIHNGNIILRFVFKIYSPLEKYSEMPIDFLMLYTEGI